jgi:hypothetical protein
MAGISVCLQVMATLVSLMNFHICKYNFVFLRLGFWPPARQHLEYFLWRTYVNSLTLQLRLHVSQ